MTKLLGKSDQPSKRSIGLYTPQSKQVRRLLRRLGREIIMVDVFVTLPVICCEQGDRYRLKRGGLLVMFVLFDWGFRPKLNGVSLSVTASQIVRYVNQFLFPSLGIESEISETTAVNWLKKIGFKLRKVKKGMYIDGHEREDVVKARCEFIDYLEEHVFP